MLRKGCIASLLSLGQPVPFEDVLSSLIRERPVQAVTAGGGKFPAAGTPWAAGAR